MKLNRRQLLAAASTFFLTSFTKCSQNENSSQTTDFKLPDGVSLNLQDQFDLSPEFIHLALFYIASHPRPVSEAIQNYRREIDQNPYSVIAEGLYSRGPDNRTANVKEAAAKYLNTDASNIALTLNTTTGLAIIYHGLKLKPGHEILTTEHDHYSHHESIRLAAEKAGASIRRIRLYNDPDDVTHDSIVESFQRSIRPQTRVVGITWVHSSTGVKLPVDEIADLIKKRNEGRDENDQILLIVDGVHGLGVENETFESLGCDFLVSGTHKWVLGPRGTGIICGRKSAWTQLVPTVPSFESSEVFTAWIQDREPSGETRASWISPGGFHAYEHRWAVADAFQFLLKIGKERIATHIHSLARQCKEGLLKIRGVKLRTPVPEELSAGIVAFDVEKVSTERIVSKLMDRKIVASVSPYKNAYVRLAPSLANTEQDIQKTLTALSSIVA